MSRQFGRRYSMADHGESNTAAQFGNYVVKPNVANIAVYRPSYEGGHTTLRIFPGLNPEDGGKTFDPYRFSVDDAPYGDFIRRYTVMKGVGQQNPVTFITHDPAAEDSSADPAQQPGWLLYNAVNTAIANKQEGPGWGALLRGGAGRRAALTKPTSIYLVQGALFAYKGKPMPCPKGSAPDDPTIIIELSTSAGQAMLKLFDELNPDWTGDQYDFVNAYKYGDPVSLEHGAFVTFYKDGEDPRQSRQQAAAQFGGRGGGGDRRGDNDIALFTCYIEPTFNGVSANLSQFEDLVKRKARLWDDILYFPTAEEQAKLLADKFPPDVITYAWRDFPDWIPDSVHRRMVGTTTHVAAVAPIAPVQPAQPQFGRQTSQPQRTTGQTFGGTPPAQMIWEDQKHQDAPVTDEAVPQGGLPDLGDTPETVAKDAPRTQRAAEALQAARTRAGA